MWRALAMIARPEMQKRAQDQLDLVVGRFRPPTFADAPNLPYIQPLIKETLRWRPALPLAIAHSTTQDDWYEGMFHPQPHHLPRERLAMQPRSGLLRPPDAASFNPERFLDEQRQADSRSSGDARGRAQHVRVWEAGLRREARGERRVVRECGHGVVGDEAGTRARREWGGGAARYGDGGRQRNGHVRRSFISANSLLSTLD
jgi:hypothetical protein